MYKVDAERNVFEEIDKILIKTRCNSIESISTTAAVNTLGLRDWFNVTQTLESLINQTKQIKNQNNNKIKLLKRYFNESHKLYKLGNLNHFPIKLTEEKLAEYSNFSKDQVHKALTGRIGGSRDFIIGMCFAFRLNIRESNLLLKAYGFNELYDKDLRDVIIIKSIYDFFINKNYNIDDKAIAILELNLRLESQGLYIISSETSRMRKK